MAADPSDSDQDSIIDLVPVVILCLHSWRQLLARLLLPVVRFSRATDVQTQLFVSVMASGLVHSVLCTLMSVISSVAKQADLRFHLALFTAA